MLSRRSALFLLAMMEYSSTATSSPFVSTGAQAFCLLTASKTGWYMLAPWLNCTQWTGHMPPLSLNDEWLYGWKSAVMTISLYVPAGCAAMKRARLSITSGAPLTASEPLMKSYCTSTRSSILLCLPHSFCLQQSWADAAAVVIIAVMMKNNSLFIFTFWIGLLCVIVQKTAAKLQILFIMTAFYDKKA